mgnify:FL=1|tara:strand:- start:2413 stop:2895 length:483 start_codon:yes stop_codon:yes gene_type:complete
MKSIARNDRTLTLIYSSETRVGQRTRAQIAGIDDKVLQDIDVSKQKLTGTQWAEIAEGLNKPIKELVDFDELEETSELNEDTDYDENDYINILNHNPKAFAHPVAILGEKMVLITNPTEIQEFLEVDSAGLKQNMMDDKPDISRQTNGEKFIDKPENGVQ